MRPYEELTEFGQIRRLHKLANNVLDAYDLQRPLRIRLLAYEANHLFRVECADGQKYVLRICSDEETTLQQNHVEAFWLQALQRDTDLPVIRLIPRADGEPITVADVPGVPPARRCMLFGWVPGSSLENHLSTPYYRQLGQLTARLHNHSQNLKLPAGITPPRWERVFYFPNEESIYRQPAYRRYFSSHRIRLLDQALAIGENCLSGLYQSDRTPQLIHSDLHYGNVHLYRRQLYILDFESTLLGFPEQDIAITLYYGRSRPDYPALTEAYRQGYSSIRPWPFTSPAHLHSLMAARSVNFINYVASHHTDPESMLPGMFQRLQQSLQIIEQNPGK